MKEKIEQFFENIKIDKKYILKDYGLNDPSTGYFLFSIRIGGSTGGSCYGSYTQEYREDNETILNELSNKIEYELDQLSDYLKPNYKESIRQYVSDKYFTSDYIDTLSDGYDFYGNYSKNGLYQVSIEEILNKVTKEEHLEEVLELLKSYSVEESDFFNIVSKEKRIKELEDSLKKFEENKKKDKREITSEISNLKKSLKIYELKLDNFEKTKKEEEENMKKELTDLKNEKPKEQKFYKENLLHKEDGPAVISSNGDKMWYYEGMLHREDGPAIELNNGHKEWHVFGEPYTKEDFESLNKKKSKKRL